MSLNFSKIVALYFLVLFSVTSNAALISVNQWHNSNDSFGGLKQSRYADDMFFAVSNGIYNPLDTYEMISGYRLASVNEFTGRVNGYITQNGSLPFAFNYYNQGGWSGYNFQGKNRYLFSFSDPTYAIHAGTFDHITNLNTMLSWGSSLSTNPQFWAGFVLIKDPLLAVSAPSTASVSVTEPASISLLCLGIAGLVIVRRQKSLS